LARGEVVALSHLHVDETLVMPEVEIRLGAVLGDEHFTVLERTHRSRIDVDVRVKLEIGDADAAGSENCGERRGGDALPQRGNNTTRYKHELGHWRQVQEIRSLHEATVAYKSPARPNEFGPTSPVRGRAF